MQIDGLEYLQKPAIASRVNDVKAAQDDKTQMLAIMALFNEIRKASKSIVDELGAGIAVTNFDEVTAALHNETAKNTKLLLTALKDLKLSNEKQAKILSAITSSNQDRLDEEFQTIRIRKSLDKVTVTNPQDFPVADNVSVNNLGEILEGLKSLEKSLETALKIDLPAPQVTVNPPAIHFPENAPIHIPEVDFSEVIASLQLGLKNLRINKMSAPLFVRMSDLDELLSKLDEIKEASRNAMLAFPGSIRISNSDEISNAIGGSTSDIAATLGDNNKTVASAGTRVQLIVASTPCKWVIVIGKSANVGTVWAGGSTIASGRGRPLVPLQSELIKVNNVNQIWIDSDTNGDGVTFVYGS